MKRVLFLIIVSLLLLGCKEDDSANPNLTDASCAFVQSIEELHALRSDCWDNQLSSKSEIEENLIGDWVLSGIKPGWIDFEPSTECLLLSITSTSLTLRNMETDEEFKTDWNLITFDINDNDVFYLQPDVDDLRWLVGMHCFSKNIMSGSGFAIDSDTYVYEKVK